MIPSRGRKKFIRSLIMLGLVLLFGTIGYMIIEDWNLPDALYMTVITITTVGYGEIRGLHEHGRKQRGQVFTGCCSNPCFKKDDKILIKPYPHSI